MSFNITITPDAQKDAKFLKRKYRSLKIDLANLSTSPKENPQQGEPLGKDCFKVRMAISSKQKGKSGGARVITCIKVVDEQIFIIAIYDKSELAALTDKKIEQRLRNNGL